MKHAQECKIIVSGASGCGTVDSTVTSDTWRPRFVFNQPLLLLNIYLLLTVCWKDENKEKEAQKGSFKKNS